MAGKPVSVSTLTLVGFLIFFAVPIMLLSAHAQPTPQSIKADVFTFDIPAQPLATALKHYASITRRSTLFRSEIVNGQVSTAVHGLHSSEDALRLLLGGTGLMVEKVNAAQGGAFVLKPISASTIALQASLDGYPSLIQASVWKVLCNDPRTAPGEYRSLLRFQVDAMGQVQRPRLLGSTGDAQRDAAMLAILQRLRIEGPPPSDMPQPVTILILPRTSGGLDGPRCSNGSGRP